MNYQEFYNFYEKKNDEEIKKNWSYAEDFTWVEYSVWKETIDFLKEFTKVFYDYPLWTVEVDYNIWFIVVWEDIYINKKFLNFCLDNKLYNERAYYFYYHCLERHMDWIEETYEESLLTYKR